MPGINEYGVGGNVRDRQLSEGMADIPMNKTLLIQKLTADPEVSPKVVKGLDTVEKVFENFRPAITVEMSDLDGAETDEKLSFNNLGDFGSKGILKQSKMLHNLNSEKEELYKFMKQIKTNKILKKVLENPAAKEAYISELKSLLEELKTTK